MKPTIIDPTTGRPFITADGLTVDDFPDASVINDRLLDAILLARKYGEEPTMLRLPWAWLSQLSMANRLQSEVVDGVCVFRCHIATGIILLCGDDRLLTSVIPVPSN